MTDITVQIYQQDQKAKKSFKFKAPKGYPNGLMLNYRNKKTRNKIKKQ